MIGASLCRDNLETFSLIWLDKKVNETDSNRQTQKALRQIINNLKTFDDQQQCHNYITSCCAQDRMILIISGQLGQQLVPQIYQLRQISSIYVYCKNKEANEQWARKYDKVKRVINEVDYLLHDIKASQNTRVKVEEPLSIKIYHDNKKLDQSTTVINGQFVNSLLLIDALRRMKSIDSDKHELIKFCKNVYKDNPMELTHINDFEHKYTPSNALWWYTCESFVYRMLNKALRVHNFELLYLFRFLIEDIYQLLLKNQCKSRVRVYRGQVMCSNELSILKRSQGNLISISSFFSTSTKLEKALKFADHSIDLHRVLFIIDADPSLFKSKPFADITQFSCNPDEFEVLFMTGCLFHVLEFDKNSDNVWIIRMKLFDGDQHDLKTLFNHMKKEYGCENGEVSFQSFGNLLHRMGENDLAEKMFNRALNEVRPDDPAFVLLCYSFGEISKDRHEYDISLNWFQQALENQQRIGPSNYITISSIYCSIGNVQKDKGNDQKAMECYNKAIEFYRQASTINRQDILASAYHGIANVYLKQDNYSEALVYYVRSLSVEEQYLPPEHSDIAITLDCIGVIHFRLSKYNEALNYYERSLKIRQKSLPSWHFDIAKNLKSIGSVYERLREWKQALEYYQKALSISSQHSITSELHESINRVCSHL